MVKPGGIILPSRRGQDREPRRLTRPVHKLFRWSMMVGEAHAARSEDVWAPCRRIRLDQHRGSTTRLPGWPGSWRSPICAGSHPAASRTPLPGSRPPWSRIARSVRHLMAGAAKIGEAAVPEIVPAVQELTGARPVGAAVIKTFQFRFQIAAVLAWVGMLIAGRTNGGPRPKQRLRRLARNSAWS